MRKRRRRSISAGTVLVALLTLATLGMAAWLLPKFTDSARNLRIDPQKLFGSLTAQVEVPGSERVSADQGEAAPTIAPAIVPVAQSTPPPAASTPSPVRLLSIAVGGSVHVPKNVRQSGYDKERGAYSYERLFGDVQGLLSGADLTLCTVESTFTGQDFTDYNAPDAMLDALKFAGVDLLSLGNERALDKGIEGLRATVTTMESKGFIVAGAASYKEDLGAIRLFQINDVQVAVLAYSYGVSNEGKKRTAKEDRFATPLLEPDEIRADIANARKAGADVVIVMPHWGTRNSLKVSDAQKALGEQLVAMGADLVVGAHPNVVQRVDRVKADGQDGNAREAIVAYSLGSLLSDGRDLVNASSMVMHFNFQVNMSTHTARLVRFGYAPIWVQRDRVSSGKYAYSLLRADDEDTMAAVEAATRRRLEDACVTVEKALADGEEVPVYWP